MTRKCALPRVASCWAPWWCGPAWWGSEGCWCWVGRSGTSPAHVCCWHCSRWSGTCCGRQSQPAHVNFTVTSSIHQLCLSALHAKHLHKPYVETCPTVIAIISLDGWPTSKNEEAKKVFPNHRRCQLPWQFVSHLSVCSLYQVIKHISTGLCSYQLTSMSDHRSTKNGWLAELLFCIKPWEPVKVQKINVENKIRKPVWTALNVF